MRKNWRKKKLKRMPKHEIPLSIIRCLSGNAIYGSNLWNVSENGFQTLIVRWRFVIQIRHFRNDLKKKIHCCHRQNVCEASVVFNRTISIPKSNAQKWYRFIRLKRFTFSMKPNCNWTMNHERANFFGLFLSFYLASDVLNKTHWINALNSI